MAFLKVATLNIRTKASDESLLDPAELPWSLRRGPMIQSILKERPDIISFQEPRAEQVADLKEGLGEKYGCISMTVWKGGDELATCWNTETTELVARSHFWLSETPDVPFSNGWDATYTRGALIGNFRLKSTQELFWVVNTHLDAAGARAREEGAKLILSRVSRIIHGEAASNTPPHSLVFLLGDFNTLQDTPPYNIFTGSRYKASDAPGQEERDTFIDLRREFGSDKETPTSDSFGFPKDPKSIDYIMIADNGALERQDNKWSVGDVDFIPNEMRHQDRTYAYSDHRMLVSKMSCSNCGPVC